MESKVIKHGYGNLDFYVANQQGEDWYNPVKPYALLEYEWVSDNIIIKDKNVMDIGSHHGHYSLVFASNEPKNLYLVEAVQENLKISKQNLELNNFNINTEYIHFTVRSEEDLFGLCSSYPTDIIKMDIEGWEYKILPESINKLDFIYCWIVELHSDKQASDDIIDIYKDMNYKLWWIEKSPDTGTMSVKPYDREKWPYRTTLVAINESVS